MPANPRNILATPARPPARLRALSAMALLSLTGCMVGPDYKAPDAAVNAAWREAADQGIAAEPVDRKLWWKSFNDPVLDGLVDMAYRQNLDLKIAGLRVLEARAQRGITAGEFFPQVQRLSGAYSIANTSGNVANPLPNDNFSDHSLGFDVYWEVDVWGRFRRAIESSDATLYATVLNYDDVLVSLVSEVATAYVDIRSLDKRLVYARANVKIQQETFDVADVRFRNGEATELDVQQARSNLAGTQSLVPRLQGLRRAVSNRLCLLLGITPRDLDEMLGGEQDIPRPPASVAIGVPAELLRRRPDIRRAERDAAAQCARIGVAVSRLYPHFALNGSIGYQADQVDKMFTGEGFVGAFGPSFYWDILNYGRIKNDIRVEDARFEQLIVLYQNTVLRAASEVESASKLFLTSREEVAFLEQSVDAASRAVDLALIQYRGGEVDFIRVLDTQTILADQQDRLAATQRNVAASVIALHRALGGGWELHDGKDYVDEETAKRMRERTDWGNVIGPEYPKGELIKPPAIERESSTVPAGAPAEGQQADQ